MLLSKAAWKRGSNARIHRPGGSHRDGHLCTYGPLDTFALQRSISAGLPGGAADACCWGVMPGDSGAGVVTHISAARIKGTFTARLKPRAGKPVTEDLLITKGTFDIGIPGRISGGNF